MFQKAIVTPLTVSMDWLREEWRKMLNEEMLVALLSLSLSPRQMETKLLPYFDQILSWMAENADSQRRLPTGSLVEEVHDIEENIWSPRLGLKGKIDVSFKVSFSKTHSVEGVLPRWRVHAD